MLDLEAGAEMPRRGWVTISGDREGALARIWRRAVAVVAGEASPRWAANLGARPVRFVAAGAG
jgi:hypothetical protein